VEPAMKAYDIQNLLKRLESKGLHLAEEALMTIYTEGKAWAKESALLSETKYDDLVVPFVDQLDALIVPQIDKIDGVKNR
jgi:hypothetical protein